MPEVNTTLSEEDHVQAHYIPDKLVSMYRNAPWRLKTQNKIPSEIEIKIEKRARLFLLVYVLISSKHNSEATPLPISSAIPHFDSRIRLVQELR